MFKCNGYEKYCNERTHAALNKSLTMMYLGEEKEKNERKKKKRKKENVRQTTHQRTPSSRGEAARRPGSRAVPGSNDAGTCVRLSQAIDRVEQTNNRVKKCGERVNLLTTNLGSMLRLPSNPPYYLYNFAVNH